MIVAPVGVTGKVSWYLLDSKTKKVLRKGKHKNLLVNGMKDSLQTVSVSTGASPTRPSYYSQRNQLVVGDNAAAPAVTDTALVNQIGASTTSAAFAQNGPETGTKDTTNNRLTWSTMLRRVYAFPSTQNIREIGFKDTGGVLTVRFLPLDGSSNPTTITGNAGQELLVEHTLVLSVPWPSSIPTAIFNIGATPYTVEYTFFSMNAANVENVFSYALLGTNNGSLIVQKTAMGTMTREAASLFTSTDNHVGRLTPQTYVAASGQRVRQGVIATGESNLAWYGVGFGLTTSAGLAIKFSSPASYTKTSANQLTIPYRSEVTLNASA
jgi:hypothetical protein